MPLSDIAENNETLTFGLVSGDNSCNVRILPSNGEISSELYKTLTSELPVVSLKSDTALKTPLIQQTLPSALKSSVITNDMEDENNLHCYRASLHRKFVEMLAEYHLQCQIQQKNVHSYSSTTTSSSSEVSVETESKVPLTTAIPENDCDIKILYCKDETSKGYFKEHKKATVMSEEDSWMQKYIELLAFKRRFGHTDVNLSVTYIYPSLITLYNWTKDQRRFYKQGKLTEMKKRKLMEIGFELELAENLSRRKRRQRRYVEVIQARERTNQIP